jgi:hypothetical protein
MRGRVRFLIMIGALRIASWSAMTMQTQASITCVGGHVTDG